MGINLVHSRVPTRYPNARFLSIHRRECSVGSVFFSLRKICSHRRGRGSQKMGSFYGATFFGVCVPELEEEEEAKNIDAVRKNDLWQCFHVPTSLSGLSAVPYFIECNGFLRNFSMKERSSRRV